MSLREGLHALRLYLQISREVAGASSHAFVDRCFWRIWRQGAEPALFQRLVADLAAGAMSRFQVVLHLTRTPQHHEAVRTGRAYGPLEAVHLARCQMVRRLPAARVLVDVGGAAPASVQGALLVMGYRHRFDRLTIVDLPPDQRICGTYAQAGQERAAAWIATEMGRVRYVHGSMTDLGAIAPGSVGLVFSGQSIEHVSRAAGAQVLREARRVLRPGGRLFLDTPNARLTRIQSPAAYIHPEHQVEYRPEELRAMLRAAGFVVEREGAVCPMPRTLATGVFDPQELIENIRLGPRADEGYAFYMQARR